MATIGYHLQELHAKIKVAVARVNLDLFHVWTETEYRYDACRKVTGSIPE
jgi:hypothetical protein